jgi:hypothetical protein
MKKIEINGKNYNMSSPTSDEYKKLYIESFGDEKIALNVTLDSHSVDGYFFELKSNITNPFKVEVYDETEKLVYKTELTSGMYSTLSRKYYSKWKTKLYLEDLVFEHEFNLENSRVFIVFESKSIVLLVKVCVSVVPTTAPAGLPTPPAGNVTPAVPLITLYFLVFILSTNRYYCFSIIYTSQ